jgi:glucose dehydrogenase
MKLESIIFALALAVFFAVVAWAVWAHFVFWRLIGAFGSLVAIMLTLSLTSCSTTNDAPRLSCPLKVCPMRFLAEQHAANGGRFPVSFTIYSRTW